MSFFTWKDNGLTSDCSSLDAMASRFEETANLMKKLSKKGFKLKKTQKNQLILEKGISNANQWKIWSRNGIEGVNRHFSWNTHVRNYLSILTEEFSRSNSYSSSDIKQSCLKGSSSLIKPH